MAYAVLESPEFNFNPLDAIEQIALANGWAVERQGDDEIVTEVSAPSCIVPSCGSPGGPIARRFTSPAPST